MTIRGKVAVVGIGELKPTRSPGGRTAIELMAEAGRLAMLDAGLTPKEIGGVLVAPSVSWSPLEMPLVVADCLGISPSYADVTDLGGASAAGQVWRAGAAIAAGACDTVLCITGDVLDPKAFYEGQKGKNPPGLPVREFETPYGPMLMNSGYALVARRHMFEYGTTPEQLAKIAVDERFNANSNPDALFYGKPLSISDVLSSELVADPLHLFEIVMPCSGAAAIIVADARKVTQQGKPRVTLRGFGESVRSSTVFDRPSLTHSPLTAAAEHAFTTAGVRPSDVDIACIYDCYTIAVLIALEDAGFCAKGRGGAFVTDHDLTYRGDFPVNTHGGQLSFGQPGLAGGASHIVEAVRQLRGQAGQRQLRTCDLAFVSGNGGVMSEEVALLLERVDA